MIDRLVAGQPGRRKAGSMFLDVVFEIATRGLRTGDQNFPERPQGVVNMRKELVFTAHRAAMLPCMVV